MQSFLSNLQQPEYVHVLINHLPLTALFAAVLAVIGGLIARSRPAMFLGMLLVVLFSLSAWPVYDYGEKGFDRALSMADEDGGAYLKHHKELAERWLWVFYVAAAAGAVGIGASWKWPRLVWAAAGTTIVLAVACLITAAVIADYGGKVRHREFRNGNPPVEKNSSG